MDYNAARAILKKYDKRLLINTPKGTGSAITHRNDQWILQVLVEERANAHRWLEKLQQIEDLKIEVIETGKIEALAIDRTAKHRPAFGGISVGHKDITAGTISSLVWDLEKKIKYILSNNHVLANSNQAQIGDAIYQPGPTDGGTVQDTLAYLSAYKTILFGNSSGPYNYADCAIAEVDDPAQITAVIAEICDAAGESKLNISIGDAVKKSGRTTAVTSSTIQSFTGVVAVDFGDIGIAYFDDLIITGVMHGGGDSGSLLLSADDRPVGLLFAGSSNITAHNRIGYVIDYLSIIFAGDDPYKFLVGSYDIEEYQKTMVSKYDILEFEKQVSGNYNLGISPYQIGNLRQLQKINDAVDNDDFTLQNDIDATSTQEWNWDESLGIYKGFNPISKWNLKFHGNYYTIDNLYINRPNTNDIGLFGACAQCTFEKIVLDDIEITGQDYVGGLLGRDAGGWNDIRKCIVSGTIKGKVNVGGMVGRLHGGADGIREKCQFAGVVTGNDGVGGLIGSLNTKINDCYCQGTIEGVSNIAGLCGNVQGVTTDAIKNCYCAVYVNLSPGNNYNYGGIYDTSVSSRPWPLISSYWDSDVCSEMPADAAARTTAQMQISDTFVDWDFVLVWNQIQYKDYPRLKHGFYWAEVLERLGFGDNLNFINLMSRLHEGMEIIDYYQFINLRDTLYEHIGLKDKIHNYLQYHPQIQDGIGFADLLKINVWSQRFLTPKIGLKDTISLLNWTQFLKQNKAFLLERYFCTLEGSGSLSVIELPITSFQGRRRENESTYLSVVVPDIDYYQQIIDRSGGTLSIHMGYELFGEIYLRQIILQAKLDGIYYHEGANEQSIQLTGHKSYKFSPKTTRIENASYKRISNGLITIRCPVPDLFLNPGDIIITPDETFKCGYLAYSVSPTFQSMEITESEES